MNKSISFLVSGCMLLLLAGCLNSNDTSSSAVCDGEDAGGRCHSEPEACTEEYAPVCGSDGNTYGNACAAAQAGIAIAYPGECQGDCKQPAQQL